MATSRPPAALQRPLPPGWNVDNDYLNLGGQALGAPVAITYNSANFTTNDATTWTVDSGDHLAFRWMAINKFRHISFVIATSTLSADTATELRIALPFTPAQVAYNPVIVSDGVGATLAANASVDGSTARLSIKKNDLSVFKNSANNVYVLGQIMVEVA